MDCRGVLAIFGNAVPKLNISPHEHEGDTSVYQQHKAFFPTWGFLLLFSSAVIFFLNYTRATLSSNCFIAYSLSGKIC